MTRCAEGWVRNREDVILEVAWCNPAQQNLRKTVKAIIDTGATKSCIPESLAQELQLIQLGPKQEVRVVGGTQVARRYSANLIIPQVCTFLNLHTFAIPDDGQGDILLGMDVLYHGTFQFTDQKQFFFCMERT